MLSLFVKSVFVCFQIVLVCSSLMETGKWCPLTKDVTIMARHFGENESIPWGLELRVCVCGGVALCRILDPEDSATFCHIGVRLPLSPPSASRKALVT